MPADEFGWPPSRCSDALRCLADASRLAHGEASGDACGQSLSAAAGQLGLELEPVRVTYGDADAILKQGGPALVATPDHIFALLDGGSGRARLVTPGLRLRRVKREQLRRRLVESAERKIEPEIDRWLDGAKVPQRRRSRARRALLRMRLAETHVADAFLLRANALAAPPAQAREAKVLPRLLTIVAAQLVEVGLTVVAWWLLGVEAIAGRIDRVFISAFLLILVSAVPFRFYGQWLIARLSLELSARLKAWLLAGALATDPDHLRSRGVGQLFSQVVESEALEQLGLGGALAGLMSGVQLAAAGGLLAWSRAWGLTGLLVICLGLFFAGLLALLRRRRRSTSARLALTHGLVERMVGHRTRLAQEPRARWHVGEDDPLAAYLLAERKADSVDAIGLGLLPRGFLIVAMALLGRELLLSSGQGFPQLAAHLGLVVLTYRALRQLGSGLGQLADARLAYEQIRPILTSRAPPSAGVAPPTLKKESGTLLECRDAAYRYPGRPRNALEGVDLVVQRGERILLTGPSGGGKSTLGALLGGVRQPTSGLVLLGGLDAPTLGLDGWRKSVAIAPQFHDNHIFGESLAFNLLVGRHWPPSPDDLVEADALCRELGLGPLLDRMPAGLQQIVGETGWQLSHGERSRIFIARSLLQSSDLLVLDESLGALDPQTMSLCLDALEQRAKAIVLIAHP
jgi:ATP-binding cassette, subfamily B, bacterial